MRAIIYARCSTDESRQDVEVQLKELRKFCENHDWNYDEVFEYESGYKGVPKELARVIKLINDGVYKVILVHDLSRFSRLHPSKTIKLLNFITDRKCRFISLQNSLDSDQEHTWFIFMGGFAYFNWIYSKNLSEKTKLGMQRAREKGSRIGRPIGKKDRKPRSRRGYFERYMQKLPFDIVSFGGDKSGK
jgi:DNA invertase Pin-like site-specific DNA recombinase